MSNHSNPAIQKIVKVLVCLLFALIILHPLPAQAVNIPKCSTLPGVAVEDFRNIKAGITPGRDYSNSGGMDTQILPNPGRNQKYKEYDVDANNPNPGNRGQYRFVCLVPENDIKPIFYVKYFTMNHYRSFCEAMI